MPSVSNEALAASSGHKAHVWQPFSKDADYNHFTVTSDSRIYCVQWNQNNKVIVSGGQNGVVTLNYNKDGALMGTLPKDTPTERDRISAISSIAFSRGSKLLAAGCMDSTVRVWDLKQQVCKYFLESHKAAVTYVTFSADDQYLASACLTGEIHLHTVKQTSQAAVLRTPGNRAKRSLHFTSLEPLLASGAEDGSLYVWDTTTYNLLDSYLQTHATTVSRVCFSPGSPNILISAGLDKAVVLTDRRLDAAIASVSCPLPLTALDCKDDGACITVGSTGGRVQLFDPRRLQAPMLELACSPGEPVSCLHWQQSASASTKSAKKAASHTPLPQQLPRGQDLLSAASPASPMLPAARLHEELTSPEKPELKPVRQVSLASEHSLSTSEASYRSTRHQGGTSEQAEAAGSRHGLRGEAEPDAGPSQNGSRPRGSQWQDSRNPLFPAFESAHSRKEDVPGSSRVEPSSKPTAVALSDPKGPAREPPMQQEALHSAPGQRSKHEKGRAGAASNLAESGRQLSNNPGFELIAGPPDTLPPQRREEHEGPVAARDGPTFGARLKRLMGVHNDAMPPETVTGNGLDSETDGGRSAQEAARKSPSKMQETGLDLQSFADDIKAGISSDIKTLHFEMIRQFHIQQAETKELTDRLAAQQKSMMEELAQLRIHVQQLTLRQNPDMLL